MTTFYRPDGARMTYAEYWRMSPDPVSFFIAAGLKLIGQPINFHSAIPRPDRLFIVNFQELPRPAQLEMEPLIRAAETAGLRLIFCHRLAIPEPHRLGAAAALLDDDSETCMTVMFAQERLVKQCQITCVSRMDDDSLCVTTTLKKALEPVPGNRILRYPGATPAILLDWHYQHLDRLATEGLNPVRLQESKLPDFVLDCELRYVDHHISRGVFVPMTDEELEEVSSPRTHPDSKPERGEGKA